MRTGTMVLKQGEIFVVSDDRGDIGPSVAGAGVYYRDTRFLSDYLLLLNDELPDLLDSSGAENSVGLFQFGNPLLQDAAEQEVLPNTIGLRRYRMIGQEMTEELELHNYNPFPVTLSLTFVVSADFRDIFDIRGFRRMKRGRVLLPRREGNTVTLSYTGPTGHLLETVMRFSRPPDQMTVAAGAGYTAELEELRTMLPGQDRVVRSEPAGQAPKASLLFHFHLDPHARALLSMSLTPRWVSESRDDDFVRIDAHLVSPLPVHTDQFTRVTTNNAVFNGLLDRSLRDLRTLSTPFPGGRLLAAGIPWFVAPFGRDSLITALQTLMFSQEIAIDTLRFLARKQGRKVDPWTEEEPGKILHEQRFGEMARLGEVPHVPYYGTVDATPLFILLFGEVMRWSGSEALYHEFAEAAERAVEWINRYGDSNGDGFIDYGRPSRGGLVNQGWKDSDNSLQYPDGSAVTPPIALVEVQGYVYRAKQILAEVHDRWGNPARAAELREEAARCGSASRSGSGAWPTRSTARPSTAAAGWCRPSAPTPGTASSVTSYRPSGRHASPSGCGHPTCTPAGGSARCRRSCPTTTR
ncbi:MAG: glycogen debranching N-terminal domain-containing protein [Sphaerobacter sp.]|nr:glycogen debranching N-terminal domain-containing protein [Sphaerobacter sp.]